jgi:hypothetical protein
MPKAPTREETDLADWLAQRAEFEAMFARSRRGNLWRKFGEGILTVFSKPDGRFAWCIASDEGPRFSPRAYDEECDAVAALADECEIGTWDVLEREAG